MEVEIKIELKLEDNSWMRLRLEPNPNGSWTLWDNGMVGDQIAESPVWPDIQWIREQAQSYANENPE
jgi:hypothetical protein